MRPAPYGPFPYSPIIRRPVLTWPSGAQVALWIIPNIEFFSLMEKVPAGSGGPGPPVPDVPSWSVRDYGNRIGVFRLMQVLDRYGVRATVALNSDVCAHHPQIIEQGNKRGDHGLAQRYAGVVDRCSFYAPYKADPDRWRAVVAQLKSV